MIKLERMNLVLVSVKVRQAPRASQKSGDRMVYLILAPIRAYWTILFEVRSCTFDPNLNVTDISKTLRRPLPSAPRYSGFSLLKDCTYT